MPRPPLDGRQQQRVGDAQRLGDGLLEVVQQADPLAWVAELRRAPARVEPGALAGLPHQRPRLVEVGVDVADPLGPLVDGLARQFADQPLAHVHEQPAEPVVERVHRRDRRTPSQRRPDDEVDHQADQHADRRVEQPGDQHVVVVGEAGREHDQGRGRDRGALALEPGQGADREPGQQRHAQGQRVQAERVADHPGDQHAQDGRPDLAGALGERAVHRGVHDQERGPRCQERLLEVEDVGREDPRDDPGRHGLHDLDDLGPQDRVPEPGPDLRAPFPPGHATSCVSTPPPSDCFSPRWRCPEGRSRIPPDAGSSARRDEGHLAGRTTPVRRGRAPRGRARPRPARRRRPPRSRPGGSGRRPGRPSWRAAPRSARRRPAG